MSGDFSLGRERPSWCKSERNTAIRLCKRCRKDGKGHIIFSFSERDSLFPHPWIWTSLLMCSDQKNLAEVMLY